MDINTFRTILPSVWSAETAQGEWDPKIPSLGQCAVTALAAQDYFGGRLLRCKMTDGNSHYWNLLSDGQEVDFTEEQFESIEPQPLKNDYIVREREYVLSFPETAKRYELLKQKISEKISNNKE